MSNTEHKAYSILTVIMAALAGVLLGLLIMPGQPRQIGGDTQSLSKLDNAMDLIEHYYVDNVDRDSLTDQMIAAMLSSLDPHSRFLSAAELKRESESIQGGFEGIGVLLHYQGDTACVNQVIPGGPAEKAGFQPGDRMIYVDTVKIAGVGMSKEETVNHIRGPHHSHVDIAVKRHGEEGMRHIKVVRGTISTPSVNYSGMLDKTTGYVRLTRFCETSYDEFRNAVNKLKRQGMKNLILDLRGNGGGLLTAAINIADDLLPDRDVIVYTQGEHQRKEYIHSRRGGLFSQGKLAIMIDEYSASASEIVAGTVQDNDRGIIIGRRSFGKGLVQRQFDLDDGSAIWLTIARYHTPSGRCIQRPYDKGTDEYYTDFLKQLVNSATNDSVLMQITDSTKYYTKGGKVVYGGGGIYPDVPLKLHTDSLLIYYNQLIDKQVIQQYAFDYVTAHYPELHKQYASADDFEKRFTVSDKMLEQIIARGEKAGVRRNSRSIAKYGSDIKLLFKANIAESLFDSDTFYRIMIQKDTEVYDALKILNNLR